MTPVRPVATTLGRTTADLVWQAALAAGERESAGEAAGLTKVIVNGAPVPSTLGAFVRGLSAGGPAPALADLCALSAEKVETLLVYARAIEGHDRALYEAVLSDLGEHLLETGLPRGRAECEMFLGWYPATPGGIHREDCDNLHLVLQGHKEFLFFAGGDWIPRDEPRRPDSDPVTGLAEDYLPSLRPEVVESAARVCSLGPGEGLRWPRRLWHVGRSPQLSLSLNVASYRDAPEAYPVLRGTDGQVTPAWLRGYHRFLGRTGTPGDDLPTLLAQASSAGLRPAPAPLRRLPSRPRHARRRLHTPVLWCQLRPGLVSVAVTGAHLALPSAVIPMLAWLSHPSSAEWPMREKDRVLVHWLAQQGVVEVSA